MAGGGSAFARCCQAAKSIGHRCPLRPRKRTCAVYVRFGPEADIDGLRGLLLERFNLRQGPHPRYENRRHHLSV
jgi:hypothetical protein